MESIKLDLIPGKKMPSLHASQYDDGREHGIDLFENGIAYKLDGTETLTINERKVDNNICSMDIENTFTGSSHIEFASFLQMCACAGSNFCELRISKGDVDIGTLNFILEVEPDPTADGIESESEIRNLKTQVEAITEEVIGDDYYTKTQTDEAIANATEGKADTTYVNTELAKKADKTDTYTKTQVDNALNNKMNKANPTGTGSISVGSNTLNVGSNSQTFGKNTKAFNQNTFAAGEGTTAGSNNQFVYGRYNQEDWRDQYVEIVGNGTNGHNSNARTLDWQGNETLEGDLTFNGNKSLTSEISRLDGKIDNLPAPMIFKGTLGVGGTIQTLPTASASNEGFTYKVITDGTYAGQTAKVGDVFTSNGSEWVLIPAGDEDNDTWRAIKVNGVEKLGNGISSGAVDFEDTANVKFEFDANGNKVRATLDGIYTESEVDDLLDDKADADNTYTKAQVDDIVYGILPDDTASGGVANFTTSLELPIKSLEVDVNAVQSAGTPTPSSPKAISGWSAITLDVNGNTEVINLGGTYYGGHFTQDKAGHRQFEVTHGIKLFGDISFSRSNNGGAWSSYLFYARITDKANGGVVKCSNYDYVANQTTSTVQNEKIITAAASNFVYIRDDFYTTAPDFETANANTQLIYPLATPYVIDLPDGEPIITLNGTNNIFADTGDSAVEYKVSVEQYVSNHSGGGLGGGLLGGGLGGAKSGGSEEEPTEESEEPKEVTKTLGDEPISKK